MCKKDIDNKEEMMSDISKIIDDFKNNDMYEYINDTEVFFNVYSTYKYTIDIIIYDECVYDNHGFFLIEYHEKENIIKEASYNPPVDNIKEIKSIILKLSKEIVKSLNPTSFNVRLILKPHILKEMR